MPKRTDLHRILVIGSGPIVIGQACEFDYSGTQACKVLRREGFHVSLVNSNPATIMTDPEFADRTYIEPLTPASVLEVIERERPDVLLPTLGGQTALNVAVALAESGDLERLGVGLIGAGLEAIHRAEDRSGFKETMSRAGLETPRAGTARSLDRALELGDELGYPLIVRPSFTLGGGGSGFARTRAELERVASRSLAASPVTEILVEESVAGWKEFELEVMRDGADNAVVICSIENVDPMGVHTGDSITVAPVMTLSDREYQRMRDAALACIRAVGVETGGSNIQFAVDPRTGRQVLIEMNPRVSRSSALASKATGFPIAKIAALLAVGYTLDEIPNDITGVTLAAFEPTLDYVVVKVPRFAFEKFPEADPELNSTMKSVGEVMAIGRTFKEALGKAWRSLERPDADLGGPPPGPLAGTVDGLLEAIASPSEDRLHLVEAALRSGSSVDEVALASGIDPWFVDQIAQVVEEVASLDGRELGTLGAPELERAKRIGLSDRRLAVLTSSTEAEVRGRRTSLGVRPVFKTVDTCAGEFPARTPYHYSTYEEQDEVRPAERPRVVILGAGPEPHRTGDRVRLRVRARGVRARRGGVRVRDGQLEPGDRLDRLRHERAPVLRAAVDRGRPGGVRGRTADRRDLPVRRADAAADGAGTSRPPGSPSSGRRRPRSTWPRIAGSSPGSCTSSASRRPSTARRTTSRRPGRSRRGSGTPSWCDRPTCSAGARWRSCTARTSSNGSSRAPRRPARTTRC